MRQEAPSLDGSLTASLHMDMPRNGVHTAAMTREFTVIFLPEDVGFSVSVPSLPGCHSQGDTMAEATANIQEAIALFLASFADDKFLGR